jgi:hypothetical protein
MASDEQIQLILRDNLPQVMLWVAVGVVLLALGVFIIRRFPKSGEHDKLATSDMMDAFRDLHARGQLSDDEYRSIKTKLASRLKDELLRPDEDPDHKDEQP